jgi:hypothetical protein
MAMNPSTHRLNRGIATALVAVSATLALSATTLATPAGEPPFDGMWSVLIMTQKGNCDPGYRYPIRISHGILQNAGSAGFTISGKVAPTGAITVTLSAGDKTATGVGRLAANEGGGQWQGGTCSGNWTAERRGS